MPADTPESEDDDQEHLSVNAVDIPQEDQGSFAYMVYLKNELRNAGMDVRNIPNANVGILDDCDPRYDVMEDAPTGPLCCQVSMQVGRSSCCIASIASVLGLHSL